MNASCEMQDVPPETPATWQEAALAQLPVICRQERLRWILVLRVVLAGFFALGLALWLNLEKPATSVITVVSVMQARSGDVLSKGLFRLIGNFSGGFVAVLFFSLFAEQRVLIVFLVAVWVFVCAAGAAKQRNSQSYGFMIAGYAACIISMPILSQPDALWHSAILRVTEIFVGIFCCGLVSEVVFPDTVSSQIYTAARGRITLFDDFVRGALSGCIPPSNVEDIQLSLIKDIALLDSYGAAAAFEATGEVHKTRVRLFNSGFMSVSGSFASLYAFLQTLSSDSDDRPVRRLFTQACERIVQSLAVTGSSAKTGQEACRTALAVEQCGRELQTLFAEHAKSRYATQGHAVSVNMGAHLVNRFLDDMCAYLMYFADLTKPEAQKSSRGVYFTPGVDMGIALASGLRAGLTILLLSFVWWWTALPDNVGSTMTDIAVIFCVLRASVPNPARSLLVDCVGVLIGIFSSAFYVLLVEPQMNDFIPLCASFFAFLTVGLYCRFIPSISGPARMGCIVFATFATPGLGYAAVMPPELLSRSLAELGGFMAAAGMHALVLPVGGAWWRERLSSGLLQEGAAACGRRLENIVLRFESGIRDALLQFTTAGIPSAEDKRSMLRKGLAMSDLGRIVIEMRAFLRSGDCLEVERDILPPLLRGIHDFLRRPAHAPYKKLLQETQSAVDRMGQDTPGIRDRAADDAVARVYLLQQSLIGLAEAFRFFDWKD